MVQTVRTIASFNQTTQFNPDSTSGLDVNHSGGALGQQDGTVIEIAAGSITVPANSSWAVYADKSGTPQLVASEQSSVPSTNALILWIGTSTSTEITSLTDVRSWVNTYPLI
jgi:hypothetical protein